MVGDKVESIDEYIANYPPEIRTILQQLRGIIRESAPGAREKISWQMPAFAWHGDLVYFAVCKNHIGFYPTPSGVDAFRQELAEYKGTKGSIHLPLDKPLPDELIRKIVRFRVAENERRAEDKIRKCTPEERWLARRRLSVGGADIYYEIVGEGTPVVTLHGYHLDHRIMEGCLEPVFNRRDGYRRLYFDLPGMGQTPSSELVANSDQMLELVEQVIQRLIGDEPYLVVGESYGGYLARGLVNRNPERVLGVLLICPMIIADRALRQLPPHQVLASDPAVLAGLTPEEREEFDSIAVVINEQTWRRFREDIMDALKLADAEYLEGIRQRGYAFSFDPDALPQTFNRPTLILTGRQDASTGYKDAWRLLDAYPHASFVVLDRAGHNLQIEQEGLFVTLVEEWLDRCKGSE